MDGIRYRRFKIRELLVLEGEFSLPLTPHGGLRTIAGQVMLGSFFNIYLEFLLFLFLFIDIGANFLIVEFTGIEGLEHLLVEGDLPLDGKIIDSRGKKLFGAERRLPRFHDISHGGLV